MILSKINKVAATILFLGFTGCSTQQVAPVSVNMDSGFSIQSADRLMKTETIYMDSTLKLTNENDFLRKEREIIKRPVLEGPILEGPIKHHIPNENSDANNGHGNGDQDAPGNSCEHNNAENADC